jgi:murein DD-endopeptidase MepM/ murein hydrolase activator NlpD
MKNTRDGLGERSAAAGEDIRVSKREADFDLRGERPEREALSRVGKRSIGGPKSSRANRRNPGKPSQSAARKADEPPEIRPAAEQAPQTEPAQAPQTAGGSNANAIGRTQPGRASLQTACVETPQAAGAPDGERALPRPPNIKYKPPAKSRRYKQPGVRASAEHPPQNRAGGKPDSPFRAESRRRADFTKDETAPPPQGNRAQSRPLAGKAETPAAKTVKPGEAANPQGEGAKTPPPQTAGADAPKLTRDKKLAKAQIRAGKAAAKHENAKAKLPAKKKLRTECVFDEKTGRTKRKLYFESSVKSQKEHLKGPLPLRPVKAAGNSVLAFGHRKISQVERENVGTEAAHKGEMIAEGGVRSALRHRKTAPYRKAARLERKSVKKSANLAYQKALAENPRLRSNLPARLWQKRKIKRDYAKAAREAAKTASRAKNAGAVLGNAGKAAVGAIKRHPIAVASAATLILSVFALMSLVGALVGMGSGGLGGIFAASYLAEDADIDNAELFYTDRETDLQLQIANAKSTHPGCDEYRFDIGEIGHDPHALMAYLTVKYRDFSYAATESDLRALFDEQYSLTFAPTTETRYADPSDSDGGGDLEPYDWHVMTVTATARPFDDVVSAHLSGDELTHYALLLSTKGLRQYLANPFGDMNWLPYVSSYYGYRIHPISGVKDLHRGVDIGLPQGTNIRSGQDGTVTFAGNSGGYGNVVIIENDEGLTSKYAHCADLFVGVGRIVKTGDVIATVGNTGNSTGPHLHLEILKDGQYLNPAYFADAGGFNPAPS